MVVEAQSNKIAMYLIIYTIIFLTFDSYRQSYRQGGATRGMLGVSSLMCLLIHCR